MSGEEKDFLSPQRNQLRLLYLLLYHNLGGEMIYILNQRLIAQKINPSKCSQVLSDIISSFVQPRKLEMSSFYGFTSSDHLNLTKMKTVFESILSSSPTMKLTPASFDKLYDLMVGVFKYQLVTCPFPSSLLHVTLNHLNTIATLSQNFDEKTIKMVHSFRESFVMQFEFSRYEWCILRSILLTNVLATVRTRISILLREGLQDMETGAYIIKPLTSASGDDSFPGKITYYDHQGQIVKEIGSYSASPSDLTNLGEDIYISELPEKNSSSAKGPFDNIKEDTKETKLLVSLLGREKTQTFEAPSSIFLDFLSPGDEEGEDEISGEEKVAQEESKVIQCGETQRIQPSGLEDENEQTEIEAKSTDDLLALMDS